MAKLQDILAIKTPIGLCESPTTLEVHDNDVRKDLLINLYKDGFFVNEDVLIDLIDRWCQ